MQMRAADDREYWLRVLAAGGTTAVPRWVTDPETGLGDHVAPIPADVLAALDAQPYGPDVPFARCCWPRTPPCWPRCPASVTW